MSEDIDYLALMRWIQEVRDSLEALVAALVNDGFSEEQARDLVVSMYRMGASNREERDE